MNTSVEMRLKDAFRKTSVLWNPALPVRKHCCNEYLDILISGWVYGHVSGIGPPALPPTLSNRKYMSLIGYARVSTADQQLALQLDALTGR